YVFFEAAKQEGWANDMGALPEGRHVFLSGCHDSELSKELVIEGVRHGAFTHYLCKTLESSSSSLSYRNIVSRINQQVQGLVQKQHPQVEGIKDADVNQLFLAKGIQPIKLTVTAKNNKWWVDAGAIQGMKVGDQLALFKDTESETALETATIKAVESEKSLLDVDTQNLEKTEAYLADVVYQDRSKLAIEIIGDEGGVSIAQVALNNMEGEAQASKFLLEAINDEGGANEDASYRLIAKDNRYTVSQVIDERPLFKPVEGGYTPDNAKKALRQLEHMAKWQHKLELENFSKSGSKLTDDVVQIVVLHGNDETVDGDVELRYEKSQNEWVAPDFGIELRFDTETNYSKPLYCALLFFNPLDGSIESATENGVWLRSKRFMDNDNGSANMVNAKPVVKIFDGEMIEAFVDDELYAQGISESKDTLKLIISETEFNASLLEQEGLEIYDSSLDPLNKAAATRGSGDALGSLLDDAMEYANTRGFRKKKPKLADWTTKSISITTIRPLETILIPNEVAASLGLGIEIEPHALTASISLETQTEASRGLESAGLGSMATPVALQDNSVTPAFSFASTRSVGQNGESDLSVIKIDLPSTRNDDSVGKESVTAENPLVISVDAKLEDGEQVLPFVFDGEFYYPVGHAVAAGDKTRILIETLPDLGLAQGEAAEKLTRGLGNSLKLYFQKVFYKTLKLDKDTVRLAIPEFGKEEDNQTEVVDFNDDVDVIKAEVEKADKVLVFIHGIIGETKSMAGAVNFLLEDESSIYEKYGLVLCFDYENLNTPIEETAKLFKEKLAQVGLAKGHQKQLHVVAHSMGGLVSRWMIEQEDGNAFVNKLIMLGTPNNGSPWAGVKDQGVGMVRKWAYGTLTLILNGLTTIPVGGVAVAGMMKLIDSIDDTLDQMGEDSDFTKALFASPDPEIPYYLVAGSTQKLLVNVDEETGYKKALKFAMQRSKLAAYDVLSATLFAEHNDVAVKMSSMKHIKEGRSPALEVSDVVSDHMSYFVTRESVEALDKALAK
ncbi:MAG: caspase family protein, partial [Thiotrichaceae bacterium]